MGIAVKTRGKRELQAYNRVLKQRKTTFYGNAFSKQIKSTHITHDHKPNNVLSCAPAHFTRKPTINMYIFCYFTHYMHIHFALDTLYSVPSFFVLLLLLPQCMLTLIMHFPGLAVFRSGLSVSSFVSITAITFLCYHLVVVIVPSLFVAFPCIFLGLECFWRGC